MKLFRFFYLLINIVIIGMLPQTTQVFASTLLMFGLGMLYDYGQVYLTENKLREKIIGWIGTFISATVVVISILGFIGCYEVVTANNDPMRTLIQNVPEKFVLFSFNVKFVTLVRCLIVYIVLAGLELILPVKRPRSTQTAQPVVPTA
jgi:hypothetical protein